MSGLVDFALIVGALIWYCSGYQTSHAIFWFSFFYILGYAYSVEARLRATFH